MKPDHLALKEATASFLAEHVPASTNGRTILLWGLGGFWHSEEKNSILGMCFRVRGFKTHAVYCDGAVSACYRRESEMSGPFNTWKEACELCIERITRMGERYHQDHSFSSKYVSPDTRAEFKQIAKTIPLDEIREYRYLGLRMGDSLTFAFNRFLKGLSFDGEPLTPEFEEIYREYFYSALFNTHAAEQILDTIQPAAIILSHGKGVCYGPILGLASLRGIPCNAWGSGFIPHCFYFYSNLVEGSARRAPSDVHWHKRLEAPLLDEDTEALDAYLQRRYSPETKNRDVSFDNTPLEPSALRESLGLPMDKYTVCLFPHLSWDTTFAERCEPFNTPTEWVLESIRYFLSREDIHWIIRPHPADVPSNSQRTIMQEIEERFPTLPDHISLIPADVCGNSYSIFQAVQAGITLCGTTGLELSLLGKPVAVADFAAYSGKGFTCDFGTKDEYFDILNNMASLPPLEPEQLEVARKYAYSYFFQRQIPLPVASPGSGHWDPPDVARLGNLLPGKNPVIDLLCERLLSGEEMVLDPELARSHGHLSIDK